VRRILSDYGGIDPFDRIARNYLQRMTVLKPMSLLVVTAVIEIGTGLALLLSPLVLVSILLGSPLGGAVDFAIARVAGAALLSLGTACWLARNPAKDRAATVLLMAMLLYNSIVAAVLIYAGIGSGLNGIGLWPAVVLHVVLASWCIMCARTELVNAPVENG